MTVHQPGQDQDAASRGEAGPPGLRPRRRAYFVMMGICLVLFILAWLVVWHFSVLAAVLMSVVAVVIPPFAAIVANNGPANRQ
jgi:hypothetical protein